MRRVECGLGLQEALDVAETLLLQQRGGLAADLLLSLRRRVGRRARSVSSGGRRRGRGGRSRGGFGLHQCIDGCAVLLRQAREAVDELADRDAMAVGLLDDDVGLALALHLLLGDQRRHTHVRTHATGWPRRVSKKWSDWQLWQQRTVLLEPKPGVDSSSDDETSFISCCASNISSVVSGSAVSSKAPVSGLYTLRHRQHHSAIITMNAIARDPRERGAARTAATGARGRW